MGKTGTVSIHAIFRKAQYRCGEHEPESRFLINKILTFYNGKIDTNEFTLYVKHRDRRLGLEMDVSHLNYHLLDILVNEFSEAKFILTIRDCYSWLDSFMDQQYRDYCYVRASHPFPHIGGSIIARCLQQCLKRNCSL